MFRQRTSGVLLHISSLPSTFGIGDLGPSAYHFVDYLDQARQSLWQVLPLNVTASEASHSPYSCPSAFAGNPLLISPARLYQDGWLNRAEAAQDSSDDPSRINFARVTSLKQRLLKRAFTRFQQSTPPADFEIFTQSQRDWLEDYALFVALQLKHQGKPWIRWPQALRDRRVGAIKDARTTLQEDIAFVRFCQYCFWKQHQDLHHYCKKRGLQLIGDIPIYVAYDSADVWTHPQLFKLAHNKRPTFKAGVPPDYFSRTGQLWGNPIYDWPRMAQDGYAWFLSRMAHNLERFDMLRVDHFRGLVAYWEVPAGHQTAKRGRWVSGPGADLLRHLFDRLPGARLFAEDLGHITPDVPQLMRQFELPGMAVLQFGFGEDSGKSDHSPHNLKPQNIVYTGTHDNNTTRGWFARDLNSLQRKRLSDYVGHKVTPTSAARDLVRLAHMSSARAAIIPMQDLLNLGGEARMNFPAKIRGNWRWRMRSHATTAKLADRLAELTHLSGRD
ncbi:4-alpha-glucanotransferase [Planctomycetota bacterium]